MRLSTIPEQYNGPRSFAFGDSPKLADEVDATFAHDEGEADRSLANWRAAHPRYFARLGKFSEDMMLMCGRFRLIEAFVDRRVAS